MPDPAPDPAGQRRIVLVVEDDAGLLAALAFDLESDGFEVRGFATAHALLAAPVAAACLVVDFNLPDLDGLALIAELRACGFDTPAVLMTTDPDTDCRTRAAAAGVAIVEKPLIGTALRRAIATLTGA